MVDGDVDDDSRMSIDALDARVLVSGRYFEQNGKEGWAFTISMVYWQKQMIYLWHKSNSQSRAHTHTHTMQRTELSVFLYWSKNL